MSLWLSEKRTTGLWKGGLWRSQQGSPYAFNLDLTTFKDTVTGQSLSCNIDGTRYDEVDGVTTAFTTDVPTIADNGLRICGAYSNLLKYSADLTQSAWLVYSTTQKLSAEQIQFTVSGSRIYQSYNDAAITNADVKGMFITLTSAYVKHINKRANSGIDFVVSGEFKAGTATAFNLQQFFVSGQNVIQLRETGQYSNQTIYAKKLQLSKKKYALPYVPTTATAPVSSPSEAGNSSTGTGIWIDDVATKFPLLNTALTSQGTLTFKWKAGFNDEDVSGNLNILSFDGTTNSISYDADNDLIKITDGTNTASKALTVVADTEYTIQATWGLVSGSPKMAIAVNGTAGTQATFTGTFNPSDIYFGLGNEELQYICKNPDGHDLTVYKQSLYLNTTLYVTEAYVVDGYIL